MSFVRLIWFTFICDIWYTLWLYFHELFYEYNFFFGARLVPRNKNTDLIFEVHSQSTVHWQRVGVLEYFGIAVIRYNFKYAIKTEQISGMNMNSEWRRNEKEVE